MRRHSILVAMDTLVLMSCPLIPGIMDPHFVSPNNIPAYEFFLHLLFPWLFNGIDLVHIFNRNTISDFIWKTYQRIWYSDWLHVKRRGETRAPRYEHHLKWIWHHYWPYISYHQEHNPIILGNKDKIWSKVSEVTFSGRHILWKITLHGHTSYCRIMRTNWKITRRIHQSLGLWSLEHHCSNTLRPSITYHAFKFLYECSNRTFIYFPKIWHGISHASTSLTYYVFKKEDFQTKCYPTSDLVHPKIPP